MPIFMSCASASTLRDTTLLTVVSLVHLVVWVGIEMRLNENSFNCDRLLINPTLILFRHDGKTNAGDGFGLILLHAKLFVHRCRLNKLCK